MTEAKQNHWEKRIVEDPAICSGLPTFRGTRILVKVVAGMLIGKYSEAQILAAYPELTAEDIEAAIKYERRAP